MVRIVAACVLLAACHSTPVATVRTRRTAPLASCSRLRVETSQRLDIRVEPSALLVDDRGDAHVLVWEYRRPRSMYAHYIIRDGRWTRVGDVFRSIDAYADSRFAYGHGRFAAAIATEGPTVLFEGLPWREVARLPRRVQAMGFDPDGALRIVSLRWDEATRGFREGEVLTWQHHALRSTARFAYPPGDFDIHDRFSMLDDGELSFVVSRPTQPDIVVRDLGRRPRAELVEHAPFALDGADLVGPDGTRLTLARGEGGGSGSCPPYAHRSVERCTPEPLTIPFQGESAVLAREGGAFVLGSLWRDTSDSVLQLPRCGADTRPIGLARQLGTRGSGTLVLARVRDHRSRLSSLPVATSYRSRVLATIDRYERVHAVVVRSNVVDFTIRHESEYVRIGCR